MVALENQQVYVPTAGRAVVADWGAGVATSIVQKFATQTERNADWPMPVPTGSLCSTDSDNKLWFSDGAKWVELAQTDSTVFTGLIYFLDNLVVRDAGTSKPTIYFQNSAATPANHAYIQHDGVGLTINAYNLTTTPNEYVRFITAGTERFRVTNDTTNYDAGVRITGYTKATAAMWVGGDGAQVRIVDTNTKTGNADAHIGFYAKGTVDAPGTMGGWAGYSGTSHLTFQNNATNCSMFLKTAYAVQFWLEGKEQAKFYGGHPGVFVLGKTAANPTVPGIEMYYAGYLGVVRADVNPGIIVNKDSNISNSHMIEFRNNNVNCGLIHRIGTGSTVKYRETSDGGLKEDIVELDPTDSIDRVKRLRPVRFRWRGSDNEISSGFIAQELYEVIPDAVLPGQGTEEEHLAWEQRMQEHYDAEVAFQEAMDADGSWSPTVEPPPKLTLEERADPYRPWMSSLTDLIPDLVAAMRILITRVEALEAS